MAALLEGINPLINVNVTLNITRIIAATGGSTAFISFVLATLWMIVLIGGNNRIVVTIPIIPDSNPTINVSALKMEEILRLEAPIALRIPISLVRSNTEIYVMIPIIIDDTTSDIATNEINT